MDKIYSRKRIVIPRFIKKENKLKRKFSKIIPIVLIAIFTIYTIFKVIDPMLQDLCAKEASLVAIEIITDNASKILEKYNYQDIVSITKSDKSNILKTDVVVINNIATEITNSITKSFKDLEKQNINIPIGALTGSKLLTGRGPDINIKIVPVGTISSEIKTEFKEKGINQTVYRIILYINCEIKVLMPYNSLSRQINNQILLVETAIVGDVPETYYNLENMTKEETIKLID